MSVMKFTSIFLFSLFIYVQSSFAEVACEYGLILEDNFVGDHSSEWFSTKLSEKDCLKISVQNLKTYVAKIKVGRGANATYFHKKPTKVIIQITAQDGVNIDQLNDQLEAFPKSDKCAVPTQVFIEKEIGGILGFGTTNVFEAIIQKNKGC